MDKFDYYTQWLRMAESQREKYEGQFLINEKNQVTAYLPSEKRNYKAALKRKLKKQ